MPVTEELRPPRREELPAAGSAGSRRDGAIQARLDDLLAHDGRMDEPGVSAEVKGGVVHLTGVVQSDLGRALARRLCCSVRGVHAVWDLMKTAGQEPLRIVDVGCGGTKQVASAFGLDGRDAPGVDCVVDLERPLPFADRSIDRVFAVHVLEHIRNLVPLMNEIHRVLKPDGLLHAVVPNWRFVNAVADPTHVRSFDLQTFKYFCRASPGVRVFRPLMAACSFDNVYADLSPVLDGGPPTEEELAHDFE